MSLFCLDGALAATGKIPYFSVKRGIGFFDLSREIELANMNATDAPTQKISLIGHENAFALGAEYDVGNDVRFRAEMEYLLSVMTGKYTSYQSSGRVPMYFDHSGLINMYWDFLLKNKIRPYVGATLGFGYGKGGGIVRVKGNIYGLSAGASFRISDGWMGDFGLKYLKSLRFLQSNLATDDFRTNMWVLATGARMVF